VLDGWVAPSPEQDALRRRYVEHLHRHSDGLMRNCRPDHITVSTLVVDHDHARALLTLHKRAGRWFQVGGHAEAGDATLADAAMREATEESGIEGLVLDDVPVHLDAHPVEFCGPDGACHLDVRFVARAPEGAEPALSAESTDLRWFPVDRLPSDEPSLHELVARSLDRLRG
jgi:8-oxo-dGTP pyrophosphatase MutT (NUDIX family)